MRESTPPFIGDVVWSRLGKIEPVEETQLEFEGSIIIAENPRRFGGYEEVGSSSSQMNRVCSKNEYL
jgi:hypothetical protein